MSETSSGTARRPRALIALQTEATIYMAQAIGQAGLAAAFLTGHKPLKHVHEINGFAMLAVALVIVATAIVYRRGGGPRWVLLGSVVLFVLVILQASLGELKIAALHIFLGVIYVVLATLFTSYLFRPGFRPRPS